MFQKFPTDEEMFKVRTENNENILVPKEQVFYRKLLAKLESIKAGERSLDDYIEEVKQKIL
jgi:hypothetical protein